MNIKTLLLLGGLLAFGAAVSAPLGDDAKIYNIKLTINHGNTVASKLSLVVLNGSIAAGSISNHGFPIEKKSINSSGDAPFTDRGKGIDYAVKPIIHKDKATLEVDLAGSVDEPKYSTTEQVGIHAIHFRKTLPVTLGKTITEEIGSVSANNKNNLVTLTVLISELDAK